jgi:hypothetical protein
VALSARSEVCDAIASISLTTAPMRSAAAARLRTVKSVWPRSAMVRSVASLAAVASGRALHDQREQSARGLRHRADVAARMRGGLHSDCGTLRHVAIAFAEIGGGDADLLAGGLEGAGEVVDGAAEALREEAAAGMAQPGLGLAAPMIDRKRIGVDQRLPHGFCGAGAGGQRTAADPHRQRGIAVTAGDMGDRHDNGAQRPFAPPRRCDRANERSRQTKKQAARSPSGQHRHRAGEGERQ